MFVSVSRYLSNSNSVTANDFEKPLNYHKHDDDDDDDDVFISMTANWLDYKQYKK